VGTSHGSRNAFLSRRYVFGACRAPANGDTLEALHALSKLPDNGTGTDVLVPIFNALQMMRSLFVPASAAESARVLTEGGAWCTVMYGRPLRCKEDLRFLAAWSGAVMYPACLRSTDFRWP
jgi:hypothetical protein